MPPYIEKEIIGQGVQPHGLEFIELIKFINWIQLDISTPVKEVLGGKGNRQGRGPGDLQDAS